MKVIIGPDITSVLENNAKLFPNRKAISDSKYSITYKQLYERSSNFARYLISQGLCSNNRIVILAEKEVVTWIAIIGVLRIGATYVPIDAKNPNDRLSYLLNDINPSGIIVDVKGSKIVDDLQYNGVVISTENLYENNYSYENDDALVELPQVLDSMIAYCLYTSGSTGAPKGVQIKHSSMMSFFRAVNQYMKIEKNSTCLSTSPIYFDVTIVDTLLPLYCGAHVHLYQGMVLPHILLDTLEEKRITHFAAVGPILNLMVNSNTKYFKQKELSHLKRIMTGAEVLNVQVMESWLNSVPGLEIINGYGPTEATCVCIAYPITKQDEPQTGPYPIGKPLDGIKAMIVDENCNPLPPGESGELLISGEQVMEGYWNKPEFTSERLTVIQSVTYYRTGDICYVDNQNIFHFIGRKDEEVKVSGYRVHLNEIKQVLLGITNVKEAKVLALELEGKETLIGAAIKLEDGEIDEREIRNRLKQKLPSYMVPKYIKQFAEFPKLPSSKTDIKTLKEMMISSIVNQSMFGGVSK
jgi:D-alanine--poly(phosphoribitol) ligase subunit 1